MVSRRNYITIAIMFLILFFMFQFTGVMKNQLNQYGVNEYEMNAQTDLQAGDSFDAKEALTSDTLTSGARRVYYVGAPDAKERDVVYWWCMYSKRAFGEYATLAECPASGSDKPDMIVLDGRLVQSDTDVTKLIGWNASGIDIIFAQMPDTAMVRNNKELSDLLGIYRVLQDEVQLTGMHLFDGFLLGGEAIYEAKDAEEEELRQDMDLTIPWYVTGGGTKTYMVGFVTEDVYKQNMSAQLRAAYATLDEDSVKNMVLPAVIWRHGAGTASVFCVNGGLLSDISGVGILEAMYADANNYDIYPVVNAQNLVVANFPAFTSENEAEMQRLYSQSASAVYKEVVWPALAALNTRTGMRMTCMITPQFDYDDSIEPDGTNVEYYFKLLKESHDEVGLSGTTTSQKSLAEKLTEDESFWKQNVPDYTFRSLYLSDPSQKETLSQEQKDALATLVVNEEDATAPLISYDESGMTLQRVTSNGEKHTFMDDFKLKSMETGLAYSDIALDLYHVTYPESDDDSWQNLMKKISANVSTFWKDYKSFDQTSLSESDLRIRRFLALDYTQERKKDNIYVSIDHFEDQAWFMLRLNGETVTSVKGGNFVEIEDGVYLIEAQEAYISISVKQDQNLHFDGNAEEEGGAS